MFFPLLTKLALHMNFIYDKIYRLGHFALFQKFNQPSSWRCYCSFVNFLLFFYIGEVSVHETDSPMMSAGESPVVEKQETLISLLSKLLIKLSEGSKTTPVRKPW